MAVSIVATAAQRRRAVRATLLNVAAVVAVAVALDSSTGATAALRSAYATAQPYIAHRMCEALVAVASFTAAVVFYALCEFGGAPQLIAVRGGPGAAASGSADWAFTEAPTAVTVTSAADGATLPILIGPAKHRRVALQLFTGGAASFLYWTAANYGGYLGTIEVSQRLLGDSLSDLHFAAEEAPSFVRLLVEVSFGVWAYDFLFYWIHRSFHAAEGWGGAAGAEAAKPSRGLRFWRRLHLSHHDHYRECGAPLHPMVTFHHSLADATLQVAINIVVQQVPLGFLFPGPRHKLSKLLHNIAVTYLLVEAHSGMDLPFMSHRVFPAIFGGAPRHQIHHATGKAYFHQFCMYLDDALGHHLQRRQCAM